MRMECREWPPGTELWLFRREESHAEAVGTVEMGQGRVLFWKKRKRENVQCMFPDEAAGSRI